MTEAASGGSSWMGGILSSALDALLPKAGDATQTTVPSLSEDLGTVPPQRVEDKPNAFLERIKTAVFSGRPSAYQIFLQHMEDTKEDVPEETRRARVVMKTAKLSGPAILAAIDDHRAAVTRERAMVKEHVKTELASRVNARQSQLGEMDSAIEDKRREVEALQRDIERLGTDRGRLATEIETERTTITETGQELERACAHFDELLADDRERYARFLKG